MDLIKDDVNAKKQKYKGDAKTLFDYNQKLILENEKLKLECYKLQKKLVESNSE